MNKIDQMIDDMEGYIEDCKTKTFNDSIIIADKGVLLGFIDELRMRIPEEVQRCQKIVNQEEAIISDANLKHDNIVEDASRLAEEMVEEHVIVAGAKKRADEVIAGANMEAERIIQLARQSADDIRRAAMGEAQDISLNALRYTDSLLDSVQASISGYLGAESGVYRSFIGSLNETYKTCMQSRQEVANSINGLSGNTGQYSQNF